MSKYNDMKVDIKKLVDDGIVLRDSLSYNRYTNKCNNFNFFISNYERWYSKALTIIELFLPSRIEDFKQLYKNDNRKMINAATYTIADALRAIANVPYFAPWTASLCVNRQKDMLNACLEIFESRIYDLKTIIKADVFDSEIDAARHLLDNGFLRSAGAICGVVLEKHFADIATNHNVVIKKKAPTIADLNDAFKDVVYDVVDWRKIQHLGDIRNLCDHNKGREPSKEEVEELINGTDRVVKTIF